MSFSLLVKNSHKAPYKGAIELVWYAFSQQTPEVHRHRWPLPFLLEHLLSEALWIPSLHRAYHIQKEFPVFLLSVNGSSIALDIALCLFITSNTRSPVRTDMRVFSFLASFCFLGFFSAVFPVPRPAWHVVGAQEVVDEWIHSCPELKLKSIVAW